MEKLSGIYKIINKTNDKYYVGSAQNIRKRFCEHKRELELNKHHCFKLQNAWNKYNYTTNDFDFIIVENVMKDKLFDAEQKYLDIAKTERDKTYNCSFDAHGVRWKNGKNPRTGRKHTEETLQKMRLRQSNRPPMSQEVKDKIRLSMTGKKKSEESKLKLSVSMKTKNRWRKFHSPPATI